MKVMYLGKEIELDDENIEGRDEFDNNDLDLLLEKTMELKIKENLDDKKEFNIEVNNG